MRSSETYLPAFDGLQLFFRHWLPENRVVSCVCLVHGLGEHSQRYSHMADFMNSQAIAVLGFDLRGHGRSQGQRGHAPSLDALMADIQLLIEQSTGLFPDLPCFLYGHSLGGLLVLPGEAVWRIRPQLEPAFRLRRKRSFPRSPGDPGLSA